MHFYSNECTKIPSKEKDRYKKTRKYLCYEIVVLLTKELFQFIIYFKMLSNI